MAITNFIPKIWSARLQRHLDSRLVYAQPTVVNRDYQGEIQNAGDTVNIQKVGDPTIKTYTPGTDMAAPERPDGTTLALIIDKQRYWNVAIDDVNAVQVNAPLLDRFVERAGRAMAVAVDSAVAATMISGAGITIGTSAAPKTVKNTGGDYTLYTFAVEARRQLDNKNAPDDSRWLVIPPDLESVALLDPQFIPAGAQEQRTGKIGQIAGFDVLKTTAVPTITKTGGATYDSWGVLFGAGNYATTHADQLVKTEAFRIEKQFGDGVKGLAVWGTKVIESDTLGLAAVSKGA